MKNVTLLTIAVFICGMTFGQFAPKKYYEFHSSATANSPKAAGWYGYQGDGTSVVSISQGYSYYIVASSFARGGQIEKVKFYHYIGDVVNPDNTVAYTTNCTDYTIEIYANPLLNAVQPPYEIYDVNIGTPVFQQTVTLTESETNLYKEVTLSQPYTIPSSGVIWIGIKCNNGLGICLLDEAAAAPSHANKYYYDEDADEYGIWLVNNDFGTQTSPKYIPFGIAFYGNFTSGISDIAANSFNVYPNPSTGAVNVSVKETSTVNVYDVTGKLVNTAHVNAGEVYTFTQTTAGMYFVNVNGNVQKVVVQ
jgi:hypothetical protein